MEDEFFTVLISYYDVLILMKEKSVCKIISILI